MSRDMKYIGMDVRKEAVVIAVLNSSGQLVMESIVETKASSILQVIHGLRGELHVTREGLLYSCDGISGSEQSRQRGQSDVTTKVVDVITAVCRSLHRFFPLSATIALNIRLRFCLTVATPFDRDGLMATVPPKCASRLQTFLVGKILPISTSQRFLSKLLTAALL
jgi:hypothetical protein